MGTVYLVYGDAGSYVEPSSWNVIAYRDRADAEQRANACNAWVQERRPQLLDAARRPPDQRPANPFDSRMAFSIYGPATYGVVELELAEGPAGGAT